MKKLIILLLAFASIGIAQPNRHRVRPPQFMSVYNGTNAYYSKTNPVGMDLNGAERLANPTFNADTSSWVVANGSMATSTVQKHAGAKSCLLVASAANASITSETITDATTDKGTGETWAWVGLTASTKSIKLVLLDQAGATIDSTVTTCTGATWTKLVKNKQWAGTQTGLKLRAGFNGGAALDSAYFDDFSLTQAWDGVIVGIIKTAAASTQRMLRVTSTGTSAYYTEVTSGGAIILPLTSETGNATTLTSASTALADGKWHIIIGKMQRDGNAQWYIDGVADATTQSLAGIGKIVGTNQIYLGWNTGAAYFNGYLGEQQFIRGTFTAAQLASMAADAYNRFRSNRSLSSSYAGMNSMSWYDWKSGGLDRGTNGNNLTPSGGVYITRKPRN